MLQGINRICTYHFLEIWVTLTGQSTCMCGALTAHANTVCWLVSIYSLYSNILAKPIFFSIVVFNAWNWLLSGTVPFWIMLEVDAHSLRVSAPGFIGVWFTTETRGYGRWVRIAMWQQWRAKQEHNKVWHFEFESGNRMQRVLVLLARSVLYAYLRMSWIESLSRFVISIRKLVQQRALRVTLLTHLDFEFRTWHVFHWESEKKASVHSACTNSFCMLWA